MLEPVLTVFFTLLSLVGVVISMAFFWGWYYACPSTQDETVYVTASDGWRLAVHHYRPQSGSSGAPVILCHGLSANRYTFDLPGGSSMAEFLRSSGRDVWLAELRGSGMSAHPGLWYSDVPYSWGFGDHLTKDLPAVIDFVLARTGAPKIHWVGHSMGGMLILAYLAGNDRAPVASAVTLGSPADFSKVQSTPISFLLRLKSLLEWMPISPLQFIAKVAIPVSHRLAFYHPGLFHPDNIDPTVAKRSIALAAEPVTSSRIWLEFGRFVETGLFASEGGRPYLERLSESKVPVLVIGGSLDGLAPPDAVAAVCDSAGSEAERKCLILGKASGCAEDYGHLDLVAGLRAREEVFAPVLEWLQTHDKAN